MFSTDDTIVAIATPPGRGGIGVVRLSGAAAHDVALRLLRRARALEPRRATFARIPESAASVASADHAAARTRQDDDHVSALPPVDQIVATRFVAPHSFTGEDVVEISGHGSPVLLQRIVELAIAAGARLAEPGEFTFRAYLNGRIDLVQAEAVADLVNAVTPLQARAAMDQLEGTLTTAIGRIDARLFDLVARLEASLDFPDEGFHFITREETVAGIGAVRADLEALAAAGRTGRLIREGALVVLAGRPNVGKSSLFNALVGSSRAIVTEVPGTTRDMLTERVDVGGLAVTLVDTAGLRATTDAVEIAGVERAEHAQRIAALTLFVLDASEPITADDRRAYASLVGARVIVLNKIDRPRACDLNAAREILTREDNGDGDVVEVSAATGAGLMALRDRIVRELGGGEALRDTPAISNVRHLGEIARALDAMDLADDAVASGAAEELILAELAPARAALEAITGRRTADDVLRHIFSRFCVGK